MADRETAEEKLARLRELILNARAMPMSASCVINRGDVLAAIDDVIDNLPDEIADAQARDRPGRRPRSPRARPRPAGSSARPASMPRCWPSTARWCGWPSEQAAQLLAEAEEEAAALRRETDEFIDQRMAGFESVLHKTASQVKTARLRLAERSGLDGDAHVDQRGLRRVGRRDPPVAAVWPSRLPTSRVGPPVMATCRPPGRERNQR